MSAVPSVLSCIPSGLRCSNVPNELVHRAEPPSLDNHYCTWLSIFTTKKFSCYTMSFLEFAMYSKYYSLSYFPDL